MNYRADGEKIEAAFSDLGYDATYGKNGKVVVRTDDSARLLADLDPVPGFNYKWP